MCKKLLSGLFGGGAAPAAPPAKAEANYKEGKEGNVKGEVAAGGASGEGGPIRVGGGLADDRKRKRGVPGLGL